LFTKSAAFYDAIYSWKDYPAETEKIRSIVAARARKAETLLDVACGTGQHLSLLRDSFTVEGVDLDPGLLEIARARLPDVPFHLGDMRTFNLGRRFDVVTCLFSSIGYMTTIEDVLHALANMSGHLAPGGVMLVEPWMTPDGFDPNHKPRPMTAEGDDFTVVRMNDSRVAGRLSTMRFHYLVGTTRKVEHFTEDHVLGLFTLDEMAAAFAAAGLSAEFDAEGLMGRGLWVARPSTDATGKSA
jgi:SAM-dependent methyltransferase